MLLNKTETINGMQNIEVVFTDDGIIDYKIWHREFGDIYYIPYTYDRSRLFKSFFRNYGINFSLSTRILMESFIYSHVFQQILAYFLFNRRTLCDCNFHDPKNYERKATISTEELLDPVEFISCHI